MNFRVHEKHAYVGHYAICDFNYLIKYGSKCPKIVFKIYQ